MPSQTKATVDASLVSPASGPTDRAQENRGGGVCGKLFIVRFELTADGVESLRLGMTREEAGRTLKAWGDPRPFRRGADSNESWVLNRPSTSMFVYCDDEGLVDAIEFASPGHGFRADDEITFEDIDLFLEPADTVVSRIKERGHEPVSEENGYTTTVYSIYLALWRDGEPYDEQTDLPLYFESALIARPGYGSD